VRRSEFPTVPLLGALALAALLLPGCVGFNGPNDIKRSIARQSDAEITQEFGIRTNGLTLRLARGLARPWVDEKLPRVGGIRNVQYGSYQIERIGSAPAGLRLRELEIKGYEPVVTISAPLRGEELRVFARERNDRLSGLVMAHREGDGLQLARVCGNLEKFLANFLEDEPFGVDLELGIFEGGRRPPGAASPDDQSPAGDATDNGARVLEVSAAGSRAG